MTASLRQLNVSVPEDLHRELKVLCRANRVPMRGVVTQLIRRVVEQHAARFDGEALRIAVAEEPQSLPNAEVEARG